METGGYSKNGSQLTLKVQTNNEGKIYQVIDVLPPWKNMEIFTLNRLSAKEIPDELLLVSTYPNPFNPVTNITFGIDQDAYIQVKIYDISGREIATLANEHYISGYHSLIWNANKQSSGLYLLVINSNGLSRSQKLILLK